MRKSRFSEEQIIGILRVQEAGRPAAFSALRQARPVVIRMQKRPWFDVGYQTQCHNFPRELDKYGGRRGEPSLSTVPWL